MKVIKTANGNEIKLSKSEWESIGKTAGWMRTATDAPIDYKYLSLLPLLSQFREMMEYLIKLNPVVAADIIQESFPKEWDEYKENVDTEYSEDIIENFVYKILNQYGSEVEGNASILGKIFYPLVKRALIVGLPGAQ